MNFKNAVRDLTLKIPAEMTLSVIAEDTGECFVAAVSGSGPYHI
jgi:hypothetical protein